jgi:hypothetical protein
MDDESLVAALIYPYFVAQGKEPKVKEKLKKQFGGKIYSLLVAV